MSRRWFRRAGRAGLGGGTAAASFSPLSLSPVLWLRADMGVTESGTVSAWADQSGAGDSNRDAVQATSGSRPTFVASDAGFNGQPTLSFDGTDDFIESGTWASIVSGPHTIYIAARQPTPADAMRLFTSRLNAAWLSLRDNTGDGGLLGSLYMWNGVAAQPTTSGSAPDFSSARVACGVYTDARFDGYVNKYSTSYCARVSATTLPVIDGYTLGSAVGGGSARLNGQIAEVIVYGAEHDATTRQQVMEYMGTRYGVTVTA